MQLKVLKWLITFTEKELIRDVLWGSHRIIHDGIEVKLPARILKKNYWITGACFRDLIERIQLELVCIVRLGRGFTL